MIVPFPPRFNFQRSQCGKNQDQERITCFDNRSPRLTHGTASTGADLSLQNLRDDCLLRRIPEFVLTKRWFSGLVFWGSWYRVPHLF